MKKHITYELDRFEIEEAVLLYLAHEHQIPVPTGTSLNLKENQEGEFIGFVAVESDEDL